MDAANPQRDMTDSKAVVYAVVVSYHPDVQRISALFASLRTQVAGIVVVDNGSTGEVLTLLRQQAATSVLKLIEFGENKGIATAHNAGIRHALDSGATHVMLFDHDSILEDGCVAQLLRAERQLADAGTRVGAVGPQYHDDTSAARAPFFRFRGLRFARVYAQDEADMVEANVLISSGCLISREVLAAVGWMDEALFIEGVDWEWCMRASSHGYRLFGIAAAKMQHSLGDSGIRLFGRILPLHSPLRHYYVFRNTILMNRMPHVATLWKWNFSLRLVIRFFVYLFFAPRRIERCRMIGRGIADGLHGRSGPFRTHWQDGADKPVSVR